MSITKLITTILTTTKLITTTITHRFFINNNKPYNKFDLQRVPPQKIKLLTTTIVVVINFINRIPPIYIHTL